MSIAGAALGPDPLGVAVIAEAPEPIDIVGPFCRYFSVTTRDYELTPSGRRFQRMPPIRQRVILALMTRRGSAPFLPDLGIDVPLKINVDLIRNSVHKALEQLEAVEGVIRVNSIDVEENSFGRVSVNVAYTDLTSSAQDNAIVLV